MINSTYLRAVRVEHVVEGEGLIGPEVDLGLTGRDLGAHPAHVYQLAWYLWADSGKKRRKKNGRKCH